MSTACYLRWAALIFLAAPWFSGCAEMASSPHSAASPSAAAPLAPPPPDTNGTQLRIAPQKESAEAIRLAQTRSDPTPHSDAVGVMEITGTGAVVVHLMIYQDSTRRKSESDPWVKEREITAYHLLPYYPSPLRPSFGEPIEESPDPDEPYQISIRRLCIADFRTNGVTVSMSQETEYARGGKYIASNKSSDQFRIAQRVPDAVQKKAATTVPSGAAILGLQPHVPWYHSSTAGTSWGIKQEPLVLAPGKSDNWAHYESITGQAAVSLEHLPFSNLSSVEDLNKLAAEYNAQAERDPQDTAARYYFAWATLFANGDEVLPKAIARLDEARLLEPQNRALPALRGRLCGQLLGKKTFQDEAVAIRCAEEILQHHPTAEVCESAAYNLSRIKGTGHSAERTALIARLLRESLTLDSPIPELMQVRLRRWQKYVQKQFFFKDTPVNQVLEEFAKSAS